MKKRAFVGEALDAYSNLQAKHPIGTIGARLAAGFVPGASTAMEVPNIAQHLRYNQPWRALGSTGAAIAGLVPGLHPLASTLGYYGFDLGGQLMQQHADKMKTAPVGDMNMSQNTKMAFLPAALMAGAKALGTGAAMTAGSNLAQKGIEKMTPKPNPAVEAQSAPPVEPKTAFAKEKQLFANNLWKVAHAIEDAASSTGRFLDNMGLEQPQSAADMASMAGGGTALAGLGGAGLGAGIGSMGYGLRGAGRGAAIGGGIGAGAGIGAGLGGLGGIGLGKLMGSDPHATDALKALLEGGGAAAGGVGGGLLGARLSRGLSSDHEKESAYRFKHPMFVKKGAKDTAIQSPAGRHTVINPDSMNQDYSPPAEPGTMSDMWDKVKGTAGGYVDSAKDKAKGLWESTKGYYHDVAGPGGKMEQHPHITHGIGAGVGGLGGAALGGGIGGGLGALLGGGLGAGGHLGAALLARHYGMSPIASQGIGLGGAALGGAVGGIGGRMMSDDEKQSSYQPRILLSSLSKAIEGGVRHVMPNSFPNRSR